MRPSARDSGRDSASRWLRALVPAAWLAALLLAAAMGVPSRALASLRPGTRVTVGVFGDSVTESLLVRNFLQEGLVPQLSRAVSALGFAPGGVGLIPAAAYRWRFNKTALFGSPLPTNGWWSIGFGALPGDDGPSGYSALAASPLATATVAVSDPDVEILYTSTSVPIPCTFTVTSAGQTWTIDTFRQGPEIDAETAITLPPGRQELTVHGPSCGVLSFDGAVAQRPVAPGQVQVEVNDLGHTAQLPSLQFGPRVQESLIEQRYDISVFLYGYLGEVVGDRSIWGTYLRALTARARLARQHGGACLIVEPTPLAASQSAVTTVSRLDRTAARRAGCTYSTVLAHLWSSPATAERRGLVLLDGIHPTAAGDRMITHALAPVIAQMVRVHLHR